MKTIQSILVILSCLFLLSCAQKPNKVVVAPVMEYKSQNLFAAKQVQLSVSDLRTNAHAMEILRQGEAAELYSSFEQLSVTVEKSVRDTLSAHGLTIVPQSRNRMEILVDDMKVSVNQELTKYQAENILTVRVKLANGTDTLTKTFKTKGKSNGPLSADIAVLERDMNRQLGELILRIARNKEIQQFIL